MSAKDSLIVVSALYSNATHSEKDCANTGVAMFNLP